MTPEPLAAGEIVQLHPLKVGRSEFAGCLMVVTDPRTWGAIGYIEALKPDGSSARFFYRASWEEIERTGGAVVWKTDP